jgi:predicted dienelactone hydrolase
VTGYSGKIATQAINKETTLHPLRIVTTILLISNLGISSSCYRLQTGGRPICQDGGTILRDRNIGFRIVDIESAKNKLIAAIWYPTDRTAKGYTYSSGARGSATENAPLRKGIWPLMIFSHGYGGSGIGQVGLMESLAARGWIIAAPDHSDAVNTVRIHGRGNGDFNAIVNYLRENPFSRKAYAYRPIEVKAVLDAMLSAGEFTIDQNKIALAGHSMGGWSVCTVALQDKRIRAVVIYSMGELLWLSGQKYFTPEELKKLAIPSIFFYGEVEKNWNPRGAYAAFCHQYTPSPSYLVEVPGGNHFTYNDIAIAPRAGGTAAQHAFILQATISFLERHMGNKRGIEQ